MAVDKGTKDKLATALKELPGYLSITTVGNGSDFETLASRARAFVATQGDMEGAIILLVGVPNTNELLGDSAALREFVVKGVRRDDYEWIVETDLHTLYLSELTPGVSEHDDAVERFDSMPSARARVETKLSEKIDNVEGAEL